MEDNDSSGQLSMPFGFDCRLKFVFEKTTVVGCIHCSPEQKASRNRTSVHCHGEALCMQHIQYTFMDIFE